MYTWLSIVIEKFKVSARSYISSVHYLLEIVLTIVKVRQHPIVK
nr:MAG TPA: hypothetical protein [Caudoviricetes sp.]